MCHHRRYGRSGFGRISFPLLLEGVSGLLLMVALVMASCLLSQIVSDLSPGASYQPPTSSKHALALASFQGFREGVRRRNISRMRMQ